MSAAKRLTRLSEVKAKRPPGGFVAVPYLVLRSDQIARLTAHGVKLLMDLLGQYKGDNNGDFCATWSLMEKRGWRSRDTLRKALHELQERGWIFRTRQGGMHAPTLYGVTFYGLDWRSKLDVPFNAFPRGQWARVSPVQLEKKKRGRQHAGRVTKSEIDTPRVLQNPLLSAA